MYAVIRRYQATPAVLAEARPKLAQLEQLTRKTPGFVGYYFLETDRRPDDDHDHRGSNRH